MIGEISVKSTISTVISALRSHLERGESQKECSQGATDLTRSRGKGP